jgi:hypothetical protein
VYFNQLCWTVPGYCLIFKFCSLLFQFIFLHQTGIWLVAIRQAKNKLAFFCVVTDFWQRQLTQNLFIPIKNGFALCCVRELERLKVLRIGCIWPLWLAEVNRALFSWLPNCLPHKLF